MESPISYGEDDSARSISIPQNISTRDAASDANVAHNSDPAAVSSSVQTPSEFYVAATEEVMTDDDIPTELGSHLNNSSQRNIDALEPVRDMVMTRSQSREMEADITTTTGVPTSTAMVA